MITILVVVVFGAALAFILVHDQLREERKGKR